MVTKEQAMTAKHFMHMESHNAKGIPHCARANGKCQTWKTRAESFSVPIKHGMYTYGYITEVNASEWMVEPPSHVIEHALEFCRKEKIKDAKEVHRIIMQSIADYNESL